MKLNFEITQDLYTLKKGKVYNFDFTTNIIHLVGENGCGKSLLINCARDSINSNIDNIRTQLNYSSIEGFKDYAKIDTDFEKIYYLSSDFDDPLSMFNATDASAFVENGGFGMQSKSTGEKSTILFTRFIETYLNKFDKNTLIVLDEIDKGLSIDSIKLMYKIIDALIKKFGCYFLIATQNMYPLLRDKYLWNFEARELISTAAYLYVNSDYVIKATDLEKFNSKQEIEDYTGISLERFSIDMAKIRTLTTHGEIKK